MTGGSALQIILYMVVLLVLVKPLGSYMARVYTGQAIIFQRFLGPFEQRLYRLCGINPKEEMSWQDYLFAMLILNLCGLVMVYGFQRLQFFLPFNSQHFQVVQPAIAFNTAISFVTNTDWQVYAGEASLSYLTQTMGLTVQNFMSAATGIAVLMALIRGITRQKSETIGNYWVDMVRGLLYILLPLALLFSIFLSSAGVIQTIKPYQAIETLQPTTLPSVLPMGLVASQVAIKQLGSNGGGYFNSNSAHPFENPNALTNFFEMLALLLIPAALCCTYGTLVSDARQGWAILVVMLLFFTPALFGVTAAEQQANPALTSLGVNQSPIDSLSAGGNMEGKEMRFGIANSALWSVATTASANGSVNAMLDSFTPLGGMIPLWLIQLGEVIFGGAGTGLAGMIIFVILTVFVAGLMVGRTPEYLGKKIQPYEMKMAVIAVLMTPLIILMLTAVAVMTRAGLEGVSVLSPHGFTQILYAFSSMANNNGSAFAGIHADNDFYTVIGGLAMLAGRYWTAIPILALAGSLARKKAVPASVGTLPTHTVLFIILLASLIGVVGALTFFPALALGPVVEQLMLWSHHGH